MFRRVLEFISAVMLLISLYVFYGSMTYLADRDYVAAMLLGAIGIGLMRSGVEIARSILTD